MDNELREVLYQRLHLFFKDITDKKPRSTMNLNAEYSAKMEILKKLHKEVECDLVQNLRSYGILPIDSWKGQVIRICQDFSRVHSVYSIKEQEPE